MFRVVALRARAIQWVFGLLVLCGLALAAFAPRWAGAVLNPPPGGPILVITSPQSTFGSYYGEILRNEGLNEFAQVDIGSVTAPTLNAYDVVILAPATLTATQVTMFTNWVNGGGNLIAMSPDAQLAPLLGLTATATSLPGGYLLINTSAAPGAGLVSQTMQYHGTAARYNLNGATSVATLYSNATTATTNPAVTTRTSGSGSASAFTYDLATSVVYMRQGNPAWATQERDGFAPIRSDDKFFGNAAGDSQADWIDLTKVAIPQADEQQRLLANLILHVNRVKKPLPRFWYFPHGKKAVVIMTGDDHANGGTAGRFDQLNAQSPAGCSVADWECLRGTSYIYPASPLTDAQAAAYNAQGHEVSIHVNPDCSNYTQSSLQGSYTTQLQQWQASYSSLPPPSTVRHHCLVWSDWSTGAEVALANGVRLDTTYYFWPPGWVNNAPGNFTGSAMPMRYSALNGNLIDVYQAATHMTDESGQTYPFTIDTLLDRATGAEGYYGAYTVNAHTDQAIIQEGTAVIASAKARGVPIVSSRQMLNWLDGRNSSSFGSLTWNGSTLAFAISAGANTTGIQAMLPFRSGAQVLSALTRAGTPVAFSVQNIKGIDYAFFSGIGGNYAAAYGADTTVPTVTSTSPASGATAVAVSTEVTATFSEAMNASTISGSTFQLRDGANALVAATVTWDSGTRTARLVPTAALAATATYTARVLTGAQDLSGNAIATTTWSFTTAASATCPCSGWGSSAVPTNPSINDPSAIEVGVKFRADANGFITGVRFYKGANNTGTHVGNLWSSTGTLLATATFVGETSAGWQQVNFSTPVAVTANTVYVASYFAPNGNYAADNNFFTSAGVDNGPVHLLRSGVSGSNGVYQYGPASGFPSQSFLDTNYWVDVVFATTTGPDTTPPVVSASTPAGGATGVALNAVVTATFNEAVDPATVTATTFELRNTASSALVSASVGYNASTRTATLTPSAALAASTGFTATVRGSATGVRDLAGNALVANVSWAFTTGSATGPNCPCTAWPASATPGTASNNDASAVELGVKFRTDVGGFITGVRFYKGANNTGTHIGNLWTTSGTLLATATFSGETATGWQQVSFGTPVAVTANTVYVASYFAPNGRYAVDNNFFATSGISNSPVNLLQNGVSGGNGVYNYGAASSFPSSTYQSSNYWVDVVFTTSTGPDTTPPVVSSQSPVNGSANVAVNTAVSATFNESIDPSTVTAANFELRNGASALVPASVSYNAGTRTATLTPSALLSGTTTFTATVRGGAAGIKDLAGNPLAANVVWAFVTEVPGGVCASPPNAVVAENCLAGNAPSEWDISGAGDSSIQGYAAQFSLNRGTTVQFKVNTTAAAYRFDIYRMGYYGGAGARRVATVTPSATLPQSQPACFNQASTGLIDCGNWAVSGSWAIPANATSGIYFAKLVRTDNGGASHLFFVVRDDSSSSHLLFQTSDTTWQAYNSYGGNSLYTGSPDGRAYKVSYNRPFNTRAVDGGQDSVFNAEYPMVRWLESNGYDVSYFSGIDSDRFGSLILNHRAFLSVGHDEYWSAQQRANVEAARNAGVHLAFFSGNEVFWKTRWEASVDGSNTPYRTLVTYKETLANAKIDPTAAWTGTWRDPRFSPPADGGRPENALTGTIFMANDTGQDYSIVIPEADGKMRFWRNTSVATLTPGQSATLPVGTLGYEWDADLDNGFRPPGLVRLSSTTLSIGSVLQDFGSNYGPGTLNHALTLYRHSSGARVFGAGTVQWSWGLDSNHDLGSEPADVRMQQATVNLLADMNSQPGSLRPGLVVAAASTDVTAPSSAITAPAAGVNLPVNSAVTITGTAADTGGVVGGVEVSVDGGATWRRATGRASWSYSWTPTAAGSYTIRSRAADDSGNLESPAAGRTVTVGTADTTQPTIAARSPASGATGVAQTSDITVTFSEAMNATTVSASTIQLLDSGGGSVAGAVSYNPTTFVATFNPTPTLGTSGTYTVRVVGGASGVADAAGNRMTSTATWTFTTAGDITAPTITARSPGPGATGVSTTGNVTVTFSEAMNASTIGTGTIELRTAANVAVLSDVTYAGNVATLNPAPTLAAQAVYTVIVRGGASGVKDVAGNALLADVSWTFTTGGDATPPTITARSPGVAATGVALSDSVTATFNEAMTAASITSSTFTLRDPAGNAVAGAVSYNSTSRVATFNPSGTLALSGGTVYTATIRGGAGGVTDSAGNPLAVDAVWSFTTTAPVVSATVPSSSATSVSRTANITATFNGPMNASTINGTTVTLQTTGGTAITSVVSVTTLSSGATRATLNPNSTLSSFTTYRVTVRGGSTGVKTPTGVGLAADRTWTFTTGLF